MFTSAGERDAHYNLKSTYRNAEYFYHALKIEHGLNKPPPLRFQNVLGIGSATGEEFEPIVDHRERIEVLESAEGFEPIVSMGDWRKPRAPTLQLESEVSPCNLFQQRIADARLEVLKESKCMFSPGSRWRYVLRKPANNVL